MARQCQSHGQTRLKSLPDNVRVMARHPLSLLSQYWQNDPNGPKRTFRVMAVQGQSHGRTRLESCPDKFRVMTRQCQIHGQTMLGLWPDEFRVMDKVMARQCQSHGQTPIIFTEYWQNDSRRTVENASIGEHKSSKKCQKWRILKQLYSRKQASITFFLSFFTISLFSAVLLKIAVSLKTVLKIAVSLKILLKLLLF